MILTLVYHGLLQKILFTKVTSILSQSSKKEGKSAVVLEEWVCGKNVS